MYLLYRGTEKLTSVHTALYRYIQPVAATVLALVRHQERIDRTNVISWILIFGGIVLVIIGYETNLFRRRASAPATHRAPAPPAAPRSRKRP